MKKNTILFLLLIASIFTGCIKENLDDCRRSFTLLFSYTGDGTTDIFRQKVTKVNLYVYNTDTEQMVGSYTVDRSALETLQGIRLDELEPGSYEAVCWGNAYESSEVIGSGTMTDGTIAAPEYNQGTPPDTNDELYYGKKDFVITKAWTDQEATCVFTCAHIDMYVRLEGFNDVLLPLNTRADGACPVGVQIANLPGYCDFTGGAFNEQALYVLNVVPAADDATAYEASFSTLRFKNDGKVTLQLTNPATGEPFYTLSVEQFLADNNLSVEDRQEVSVSILLRLNSDGISMTVKPFDSEDVHPGLDEKDM